jgi:hypothetical protein
LLLHRIFADWKSAVWWVPCNYRPFSVEEWEQNGPMLAGMKLVDSSIVNGWQAWNHVLDVLQPLAFVKTFVG